MYPIQLQSMASVVLLLCRHITTINILAHSIDKMMNLVLKTIDSVGRVQNHMPAAGGSITNGHFHSKFQFNHF